MKDRTKQALAISLQELLKSKTLDQVRVSELCTRCGLQRQSFYYHFQDKYDLAAWIFLQDFNSGFSANGYRLSLDCMIDILNSIYRKKDFYLRVLADRSQNLPLMYIQQHLYDFCIGMLCRRDGVEEMSEKICFMVQYMVYGVMGAVWEWLNGRIDQPTDTICRWVMAIIPQELLTS